ncbi:MAG: hypothetical protein E7173_01455 [Firmicutes bacterium]|nr:hypothetical protein [Bacillota bacterium]
MKKIVPFKKDILLESNIAEITSISLEHTLKVQENNIISGNFIISGEYRMSDSSTSTDSFNFELPCNINLDERYVLDYVQLDIDDFYYEVVNSNILQVNIDVLIDKLDEKAPKQMILNEIKMPSAEMPILEEENDNMNRIDLQLENKVESESRCVEEEDMDPVTSIFDSFNENLETYKTYKVYIVREGDTLDMIMQKYSVSREELEMYNDLSEICLGDKIIVPDFIDAKN